MKRKRVVKPRGKKRGVILRRIGEFVSVELQFAVGL